MNYLAHLFLAQPTAESRMGNLLGDFMRGQQENDFSEGVIAGLYNHRLVDRFTDNHAAVKSARTGFSASRRRFAGVTLDIVFDHFLLKHFSHFSNISLKHFIRDVYHHLNEQQRMMPDRMRRVVGSMVTHKWLESYADLSQVGIALDRTASRIRFRHSFHGVLEEVEARYDELECCFLALMPALVRHVRQHSPEEWRANHIALDYSSLSSS